VTSHNRCNEEVPYSVRSVGSEADNRSNSNNDVYGTVIMAVTLQAFTQFIDKCRTVMGSQINIETVYLPTDPSFRY